METYYLNTSCAYFWMISELYTEYAHLMRLKGFKCGEQAITIVQLWIESSSKQTMLWKRQENGKLAASTLTTILLYDQDIAPRMHTLEKIFLWSFDNILVLFVTFYIVFGRCRRRRRCCCYLQHFVVAFIFPFCFPLRKCRIWN